MAAIYRPVVALSGHFTSTSSAADDPLETCTETEPARTLISKLKAPTRSPLCHPRKVATNLPRKRMKRPSVSLTSNPSYVSPIQRAKEFTSECVCLSGGKLFCQACREEL